VSYRNLNYQAIHILIIFRERYCADGPVSIRVGTTNFVIIADPEQIQGVFKQSRMLSNKSVTLWVLENLLGATRALLSFYKADDSGMAAKPRPGSKVKQEDRVFFFQIRTAHTHLSGLHLHAINDRFMATLERDLDTLNVGQEWVEYPDLYKFLQCIVTPCSIETIYGTKLLELNPDFVNNFWEFESNAPRFLHAFPRRFMTRAYEVREKLIEAFEKTHLYANEHSDCSRIGAEEPEWEPNFGSKLLRSRQYGMLAMKPMDARARATEDLGLMFGYVPNSSTVCPLCTKLYSELTDTP
jgi:hypothetical protein